jgi:hypothetical protein
MSETTRAGRELDALVAEKVMGWPTVTIINGCPFTPYNPDTGIPYRSGLGVAALPFYSTDIAAAWDVVELMREQSYTLELYSPDALVNDEMGIYARGGWRATFLSWKHIGRLPSGDAEACATAPLAVCLAALAATVEGRRARAGGEPTQEG